MTLPEKKGGSDTRQHRCCLVCLLNSIWGETTSKLLLDQVQGIRFPVIIEPDSSCLCKLLQEPKGGRRKTLAGSTAI